MNGKRIGRSELEQVQQDIQETMGVEKFNGQVKEVDKKKGKIHDYV